MITNLTATAIGVGVYRLSWSSDASNPVFRVFVDGILVATTPATSFDLTVAAGESPVVEVLDDAEDEPLAAHPTYVTLAWFAEEGEVERFRVEQQVEEDWVVRAVIRADGRGYYTWRSASGLADDTVHQYRVVPIGVNTNTGTVRTWSVRMVRRPDVPAAAYAYDSDTGKVTIQ